MTFQASGGQRSLDKWQPLEVTDFKTQNPKPSSKVLHQRVPSHLLGPFSPSSLPPLTAPQTHPFPNRQALGVLVLESPVPWAAEQERLEGASTKDPAGRSLRTAVGPKPGADQDPRPSGARQPGPWSAAKLSAQRPRTGVAATPICPGGRRPLPLHPTDPGRNG